MARGRVGGPQARGPVRGGRNPAASGARGAQRPAARGGVVRAKGSLPGEDGLYLRDKRLFFYYLLMFSRCCFTLYYNISFFLPHVFSFFFSFIPFFATIRGALYVFESAALRPICFIVVVFDSFAHEHSFNRFVFSRSRWFKRK